MAEVHVTIRPIDGSGNQIVFHNPDNANGSQRLPPSDVRAGSISRLVAVFRKCPDIRAKTQLPLINDNPRLPVPGIPGNAKNNAKALAMILTIESVRLVLPKIKALTPEELREFRSETAELVKPFRLAMLRMAKDLNAAITSEMTLNEVQSHAKFLVETSVYPELRAWPEAHLKSSRVSARCPKIWRLRSCSERLPGCWQMREMNSWTESTNLAEPDYIFC